MKKLLLATTALTLSAGIAAADVSLSGDGRMGFLYDGDDVNLISRARVTFTLSGETDHGMAFGGSFRADNAPGAASGTAGSVFISGAFGRLAMGDVAGAARAATGDLFAVGLTDLEDAHEMQYVDRLFNNAGTTASAIGSAIGAGFGATSTTTTTGLASRPRALYTYNIDGLTVYASVAFDKDTFSGTADFDPPVVAFSGDVSVVEGALGVKYEMDGFMVAAGYERTRIKLSNTNTVPFGVNFDDSITLGHATLAAGYTMDGISAKAIYGRAMNDLTELVADRNQYGLAVSGTFDATTVTAFGRRDFAKDTFLGLGASYDLGGGASLKGGVVNIKPNGGSSETVADFGLAFTF